MCNENNSQLTCESFEYRSLGNLRFIGIDAWPDESWDALWARKEEFMPILDQNGAGLWSRDPL